MRLSRFFIDDELILQQSFTPGAAVAHYMRHVLRLQNDDEVILFNGKAPRDYRSRINFQGKKLTLTPLQAIDKHNDSALDIHLLLAVGKPEHIDLALQKSTELGARRITLFNSERTQTPIRGKRLDKKLTHWRGVLISACEQCDRNAIPTLAFFPSLEALLQNPLRGNRLILDFAGTPLHQTINEFESQQPFHCLLGAEGGLAPNEISLAWAAGFNGVLLGPRILRMETAAISIVTLIQHHHGDLG